MARKVDDRVRLLFGPYQAPKLRRGDRAFCWRLDCTVVVTGLSDAPISWPLCRPLDNRRGQPTLLLAGDLVHAVRNESAAAVGYWWGVGEGVVWRWRKALDVSRTNNRGTQRLIQAASECGAAKVRGVPLPPEQVERRRETAIELGLIRNARTAHDPPLWRKKDIALLGVRPDAEVACLTGRSVNAVRLKRERLRRANPCVPAGSRALPRPWTEEEDRLVLELSPRECARRISRTLSTVYARRHTLSQPKRRRVHRRTRLKVKRILAWAIEHCRRTGEWPTKYSGPVGAAPGETWNGVNLALRKGQRGLRGGDTLKALLRRYRRGRRRQRQAKTD